MLRDADALTDDLGVVRHRQELRVDDARCDAVRVPSERNDARHGVVRITLVKFAGTT